MRHYIVIFLFVILKANFLVGVGGYDVCKKGKRYIAYNSKCKITHNITDVVPKNVNAISIWITKNFDFKSWFRPEDINRNIVAKGYIPIFIVYWFRDDISPNYIQKHKKEYFLFIKKFDNYLSKINGKKYIIVNPEYNENGVSSYKKYNDLMEKTYKILKTKNRMLGYGVGDFGVYGVTFDFNNFKSFDKSFKAVKYYDFIAFQEMRAITRNSKSDILNTPYRTLEFAIYLHKRYKKPTFLAYLAISSYKAKTIQAEVFKRYSQLLPIFKKEANLIGFNLFHYFDTPQQVGYFKEAEKFFGVIDNKGNRKDSYKFFIKIKPY
jgi:hypothetical protein